MAKTILAVDDEVKYLDIIKLFLNNEGFRVLTAQTGQDAIDLFETEKPDLVLLDVMLPDMSGFEVCNTIRKSSDVLILFLSALEDEDFHIAGYRAGADDYIAKPFKGSVLALKIRKMLERQETNAADTSHVYTAGNIRLDADSFRCTLAGEPLNLTAKEFNLLAVLMKERGRVLSRNYLLNTVWGYDFIGDIRVVDSHITKLRRKLGDSAQMIKTVINVGYKLEDSE